MNLLKVHQTVPAPDSPSVYDRKQDENIAFLLSEVEKLKGLLLKLFF